MIAIRTINFEKVRFDLNVMRADIKEAKLNADCFLYLRKYAVLLLNLLLLKLFQLNIL